MDGPKLEWMYKNASECVDNEEYLLGKPIDKTFEQSQTTFANEIEKDCLPTSIFASSGSNVQVDVIRKLKEDPLELIKQQEIERRKQLLKNPVKLKKIQNMINAKENGSMSNKKSREKKTKSNNESEDIDKLLTSKYLKIMKKHGIRSLSELSKIKVENKKKNHGKSKKSVDSSSDSSSTSDSDSDEPDEKRHKKRLKIRKERNSNSSSSDDYKKKRNHSKKEDNSRKSKVSDKTYREKDIKSSYIERSSQRSSNVKSSRTDTLKDPENRKPNKRDLHEHNKPRSEIIDHRNNKQKTISDTEKEKRLKEMMENAKWRDEVRSKNVARYKKEESSEKVEKYSEDFMRNQMVLHLAKSQGSVESRIKSNINYIQKSKFTMNENFVRR